MARVLVTGGAGTIGAAVVRRLIRDPDWEYDLIEVYWENSARSAGRFKTSSSRSLSTFM